jgi:hypothetical protein
LSVADRASDPVVQTWLFQGVRQKRTVCKERFINQFQINRIRGISCQNYRQEGKSGGRS